jgi:CheY-like chemotaxis protein
MTGDRTVTRILLAEDNPADVYLLREALAANDGAGIELIVVSDGEQAIDYLSSPGQDGRPRVLDLVVLDLNLPKSDGGEVLESIRQDPNYRAVPVIILTSSDSPSDRETAQRLGANCYLTKPSDLDAFMALGGKLMAFAGAMPVPSARAACK